VTIIQLILLFVILNSIVSTFGFGLLIHQLYLVRCEIVLNRKPEMYRGVQL